MSDSNHNNHLSSVYEQYWNQARHVENEKLQFTTIFAIIIAGVLAFLSGTDGDDMYELLLLGFLTGLSFFGYLIAHAWNIPFVTYSRLAEEIAICEWDLKENYQRYSNTAKVYEYQKYMRILAKFPISAGDIFMAFYSIMIGVFGALFYYKLANILLSEWLEGKSDYWIVPVAISPYTAIGLAVLIMVFFSLYYIYYLRKQTIGKIIDDFNKRVDKFHMKKESNNNA